MSPWDAMWIACEWGSSGQTWQRLEIARELARAPVSIVGASFVLDALVSDEDPDVQSAAHVALKRFRY
jgi:hypothetical protein